MLLLLRTILWPPVIDQQGYHTSDQWAERRRQYWKDHPKARCRVSFVKAEKTVIVLGFRRAGFFWRPVVMRTETARLHLHELIYPPHGRYHVPSMWLMPLAPSVHTRLHRFDRWLFPWDHRNRLLWLSTLLYVYGRYLPVLAIAAWLIWRR